MRLRRMAALAGDDNFKLIRRGHQRTGTDGELSDRQARCVMKAVHFIDFEPVHHPIFAHRQPAAPAFFGGLKDDGGASVEIPRLAHVFRCAQQHGCVPIVAASVHLARDGRRIGQAGRLWYWQRIHISAQANGFS